MITNLMYFYLFMVHSVYHVTLQCTHYSMFCVLQRKLIQSLA